LESIEPTLKLFTLPHCPNCPAAKDVLNRFRQKHPDVKVEVLDMAVQENYLRGLMLQISVTPSFVYGEAPLFVGEVPTLEELEKAVDRLKS